MKRSAAVAGLLLLAAGCGHRGPLIAPLPPVPQSPRDAAWRQRGDVLEVRARYQLTGLEGRKLHPPAIPVLLCVGSSNPGDAASWNTAARDREFGRVARKVLLPPFETGQLGQAVSREDRVQIESLGAKAYAVLSVALTDKRSRSSGSPRMILPLAWPALPALIRFDVSAEEKGVHLKWALPADSRITALRLYRWEQGSPVPWEAWKTVSAQFGELLDDTARYGQVLHYAAAPAMGQGNDPVEGPILEAGPLDYRDIFPPAPPKDLDLVAETSRLRLLWNPGNSPDEAFTIVEREEEGTGVFQEVGKVAAPDSFFQDDGVQPGKQYRYRLMAIDRVGNRTAPTEPTGWLAPRPPPIPEGNP